MVETNRVLGAFCNARVVATPEPGLSQEPKQPMSTNARSRQNRTGIRPNYFELRIDEHGARYVADTVTATVHITDPDQSKEVNRRGHSGAAIVTDGGLPEHLTEMSTLDGGAVIHCKSCGAEGDSPEKFAHHPNCSDVSKTTADGGQPIVNIETERVFVEIDDGGGPISIADGGTIEVRSRSDRLSSEATYLSAHVRFDGEDSTVEVFLTEDQITQLREALFEAQWGDEHE